MIFAPHILQVKVVIEPSFDENMNPISCGEDWKEIGSCRCDDNGVMKQISVNGMIYDYSYHVVYEGERIKAGTEVRVFVNGEIRAEGTIVKSAKCNFFSYSEIWL